MRCGHRSTSLSVRRAVALRRRSGWETNTADNRLVDSKLRFRVVLLLESSGNSILS